MALAVKVVTLDGDEISEPYLVRIAGWTEERYFREAPETWFFEFEDGEVIVHSPTSPGHQELILFLSILLQGYLRHRRLGKVLNGPAVVRLRPGLNYEPDIFFIPQDQLHQIGAQYFGGVPGLIVEVISSGSRNHDLRTKANAYWQHGVPEYWAVDPERRILFQHLLPRDPGPYRVHEQSGGRLESIAIPGFWLDVSWLWQDPLPNEFRCLDQILAA